MSPQSFLQMSTFPKTVSNHLYSMCDHQREKNTPYYTRPISKNVYNEREGRKTVGCGQNNKQDFTPKDNELTLNHCGRLSRRRFKDIIKFLKKLKIIEFYTYIWNDHGKCLQMSTNTPGIGLVTN